MAPTTTQAQNVTTNGDLSSAQSPIPGKPIIAQPLSEPGINKMMLMTALITSDREERSLKNWLYLAPGPVKFYHYEWVDEYGKKIDKIEAAPIKGVPDRRPLVMSHPNWHIALWTTQCLANTAGGFAARR